LPWAAASGQPYSRYGYGGASTPQGDYLRGVGVAAHGLGVYNLTTAEGNSINADTMIRVNEYVAGVAKYENHVNAVRRKYVIEHNRANYDKIRERILENPEERDVMNGGALNAVLQELMGPEISESSFRLDPVPLSVDVVRTIPFKIGEQGVNFSMQRLSTKGKNRWPVALQDDKFAAARRAYERAVDDALDQQIDGKMSLDAIKAVETAVDGLFLKLDQVITPSKDKLYMEAKNRLTGLKTSAQLLKSHKIEIVLGEIDRYAGTTVNDLRLFMQTHKLRFSGAESGDERKLLPELYAALIQQKERVTSPARPRGR
jgi:hypothetical protein